TINASGTTNAANITFVSGDGITTGNLVAAGLNNGNGANISLDSGTASFTIGSLVTRNTTGSNVSNYSNDTGSGRARPLSFKQSGGSLMGASVGFTSGAAILIDGGSSDGTSTLALRLANTNALGDISTANAGAGPGGSIVLTSASSNSITLGQVVTKAAN